MTIRELQTEASSVLIYLASPYTHPDPRVVTERFEAVCREAAYLMRAGIHVLSPIAHTHPIAQVGDLPTRWEFWEAFDRTLIAACKEVWVLQLDGWRESRGVAAEIAIAEQMGKRVRYRPPFAEPA